MAEVAAWLLCENQEIYMKLLIIRWVNFMSKQKTSKSMRSIRDVLSMRRVHCFCCCMSDARSDYDSISSHDFRLEQYMYLRICIYVFLHYIYVYMYLHLYMYM